MSPTASGRRRSISTALETVQLPYRLTAKWRANVSYGNVAFEVALTPEAVWPSSMFVPGVGLVASSREMRRKAASAYALRVALLLASVAFRSSERIRHVWVAGTIDTATRHRCYLSVDFDRGRSARLHSRHARLPAIYRPSCPRCAWRRAYSAPWPRASRSPSHASGPQTATSPCRSRPSGFPPRRRRRWGPSACTDSQSRRPRSARSSRLTS